MKGVLIDTSVWIDFFNGVQSPENNILTKYIRNNYPVFLCPVILQEILQGFVYDSDYKKAKELLLEFPFFQDDPIEMSIAAADLYRSLRKKGVTIRKSNDCLIAAYCIKNKIAVLHINRDFNVILKYSTLEIVIKK
jgi:predicted nucleic acid-binding protein